MRVLVELLVGGTVVGSGRLEVIYMYLLNFQDGSVRIRRLASSVAISVVRTERRRGRSTQSTTNCDTGRS